MQYLHFVRRTGAVTSDTPAEVPFELILADGSVYPHQGQVAGIDRALDPQTGTITVHIYFPNPR
jgi:membrane fusion protein (multidrug efflux system)